MQSACAEGTHFASVYVTHGGVGNQVLGGGVLGQWLYNRR